MLPPLFQIKNRLLPPKNSPSEQNKRYSERARNFNKSVSRLGISSLDARLGPPILRGPQFLKITYEQVLRLDSKYYRGFQISMRVHQLLEQLLYLQRDSKSWIEGPSKPRGAFAS